MSATSHSPTPVTDIAEALHEKFYKEHPEHVPLAPAIPDAPPAAKVADKAAPQAQATPDTSTSQHSVSETLANAAEEMTRSADVVPPQKRRIRLSYGAGVALIAGGVAGVVLPGIPGFPLLILGAAVLAPTVPALASADTWVQESFPEVYKEALDFADRFANDFEKRFPAAAQPSEKAVAVTQAPASSQKQ